MFEYVGDLEGRGRGMTRGVLTIVMVGSSLCPLENAATREGHDVVKDVHDRRAK